MVAQPRAEPSAALRLVPQPRAAVYVRVSDPKQEAGYSLPTQEARCREYAAEHGYAVAEVYREVFTGTELWERPELTRLRQAMARREVDALICFDPDRFSRKQVHTALLQGICEQAGVELRFAEFDFTRDATGQFLLNARVFAAELEREKIIERTQRGRVAKLRAGKLAGNTRPPYGYRYADAARATYALDEATAPLVRRMFALAAGGATLRSIAARLTAEGIPTPTGNALWQAPSVRHILTNPAYVGDLRARRWGTARRAGKTVNVARPASDHIAMPEGVCPPLIDRATFDLVRERLGRNRRTASRNASDPERFLLRGGYARCACGCGRALVASVSYKGYPAYHANAVPCAKHGGGSLSIVATKLDRDVWDFLTLILGDPSIIAAEIPALAADETAGGDVAAVEQLLATVARQQANVAAGMAALDDADARAPLVAQLQALAERKRALEAEHAGALARRENWRAVRERLDILAEWGRHWAARAATMPYNERRDWLAALGLVVEVQPAGVLPRYRLSLGIPLPDGGERRIVFDGSTRCIVDSGTATTYHNDALGTIRLTFTAEQVGDFLAAAGD